MLNNQGTLLTEKVILSNTHRNRRINNQYFTPEFIVKKVFNIISYKKNIKNIIDPAVGNGVFLSVASKIWENSKLFGIDIDKKIIQNLRKANFDNMYLHIADSIQPKIWEQNLELKKVITFHGGFDLVVGNPPFSSWYDRISDKNILLNYKLGNKSRGTKRSQAIEVLFLEEFIKLSKVNGYIIIILPEGILSNPRDQYIREFILGETIIKNIVSIPKNTFEKTDAKTSILVLERKKNGNNNYTVKISDLEKDGKINHTIQVKSKDLIKRMDYWYYYNLEKCTLKRLMDVNSKIQPLKNYITCYKKGKTIYGKERKFSIKGLRYLHSTHIRNIGIDYKRDKKFISMKSKMNFKEAKTKLKDIVIVRVGDGCLGNCAIIDTKKELGIASDCLHIFRVKNISPYFLTLFLKTKHCKEWFNAVRHGSVTTCITQDEILSLPVPVVHGNSQNMYEMKYKKIIRKWNRNIDNNKVICNDFKALIRSMEEKISNGIKIQ